jgi:hypothetical protein
MPGSPFNSRISKIKIDKVGIKITPAKYIFSTYIILFCGSRDEYDEDVMHGEGPTVGGEVMPDASAKS